MPTPAPAVTGETVRDLVADAETRLHDTARDATAEVRHAAATLRALTDQAHEAADRVRASHTASPSGDGEAGVLPFPAEVTLPGGDAKVARHLRQAGYDDRQIAVMLGRDIEGERRRAA